MEFYRYEDFNSWNHFYVLRVLYLVKETPKGWWISDEKDYLLKAEKEALVIKKRWISKTSRKRFAYPTREEALNSYKARKKRQIIILKNKIERAISSLHEAEYSCDPLLTKYYSH